MYHELVYHLDLCMLSYHMHAQTLIWPLDPYMEQVATSTTSRRENFMLHTHEHFTAEQTNYHGPGVPQGWPTNVLLDPIMSRYNRLYPWRPVFLGGERHNWLWHNSPKAIIDPIREVYMQTYGRGNNPVTPVDMPPLVPPRKIATRPDTVVNAGTDRMYCFEGGTGTILGSAASWSLMGFCLMRNNPDGTYDVHIAYRGSRSGAAGRAAGAGLQSNSRSFAIRNRDESGERHWVAPIVSRHAARGNGDWITDMDFGDTIPDEEFSSYGSVCRGFAAAQKTCIPLVVNCLAAIHAVKGGPPRTIWATGHSLGGGLASEFASAMVCGTKYGPFGSKLSPALQTWPWRSLRLITMSCPVVGGKKFHATFNSRVYTRRVMLGKDPITQELRHWHVGGQVHLHETPGSKAGIPWTGHHEPWKVRRSLMLHIKKWGDRVDDVPLRYEDDDDAEPWIAYKSFVTMLRRQNLAAQVPAIMADHPEEFAHFLEILLPTMKDKSTHNRGHGGKKPWAPRVSETEKAGYDTKIGKAISLLRGGSEADLRGWYDCLSDIGGPSFTKYLKLGMLVAACVKGVRGLDGGPLDLVQTLIANGLEEF